jgi:pheromone shutdown protein TraB
MSMAKTIIIGTSHISSTSVDIVKKAILKEKPDCVAIELCLSRYHSLQNPSKPKDPIFRILSTIQKELGKSTGIFPGSEMLTAIETGRSINSKIAFIDKPIQQIAYDINSLPISTKLRLVFDSIFGLIIAKLTNLNLNEIPPEETINQALKEMKKIYPVLYKILITSRNKHMIKKIKSIEKNIKPKKLLVVVGAGHKKALERALKKPKKK